MNFDSTDISDPSTAVSEGLARVQELLNKTSVIDTPNFRDLLIEVAGPDEVLIRIISDAVQRMRCLNDFPADEQTRIASDASVLYAPLAHQLGLYQMKTELEDLSMKFLEHDPYYMIKDKLSETKRSRDAYIEQFIIPVEQKLRAAGLKFHMKGRTKSIHSIWQKMKKQKCGFENIYDLFAIRIILDSAPEREKIECWQTYSIITDMYKPNPRRLRDWLSVPKANGYESLHTTVLGPSDKWVEVQIRTERMDDIAEHGLAAHWRYKGIKAGSEHRSEDVFVFTPKGDLFKLPKGATILDFAFAIHTGVGSHCSGGLVNGKNSPVRTQLHSGDQVSILTNPNQKPNQDWLNYVVSGKARTKIKQLLNKEAERLEVRDEGQQPKANSQQSGQSNSQEHQEEKHHADEFVFNSELAQQTTETGKETLIIDKNVKGLEYSFAKCCNPIFGDRIVGFVTLSKGITIHRADCRNAQHMLAGLSYREIPVKWSDTGGIQQVILHIIGNDDLGIVNNITSIILREHGITLRGIDIKSSEDGLFSGDLTLTLSDSARLKSLIRKIQDIKGIKKVTRN